MSMALGFSSLCLGQVRVWLASKCLIFYVPFVFSDLVALEADDASDASQSFGKFAAVDKIFS